MKIKRRNVYRAIDVAGPKIVKQRCKECGARECITVSPPCIDHLPTCEGMARQQAVANILLGDR